MDVQLFKLDAYIEPLEAFHFARKTLPEGEPPVLHRHDYYELFLVESGRVRHFVNGETETLERGALLFIRPDDKHSVQAVPGAGSQIINVMFRVETADHLLRRYESEFAGRYFWLDDRQPAMHVLKGPRMERAVNSALELQTSLRSLALVEQFLLSIMARVVDFAALLPRGAPGWLASACEASLQPEVFRRGVSGFVDEAGRGHEHVCRTMRRHMGLSPSAYLNRIRMEFAAMRLGADDMPIPEIAHDCGIENISHFYKLFRGHYGTTPRKYRERHRLGIDRAPDGVASR